MNAVGELGIGTVDGRPNPSPSAPVSFGAP
jgi:hypothetical protein